MVVFSTLRLPYFPLGLRFSQADLPGTANEPKRFLEIAGSHNAGYLTTGDKYDNGIKSFLDAYLTQ